MFKMMGRGYATFALLLSLTCLSPASAQTFTGNTAGQPTYQRTLGGTPPTGLSGIGTAVPYQTFGFTTSVSGSYAFEVTAGYDNFLSLYQNAFNPANALSNVLVSNDDNPTIGLSGFTRNLTNGTQYFLVSTGYSNTDFGTFNGVVTGPAALNFAGVAAVPEPAAWALLILGFGAIGSTLRRNRRARPTPAIA
ncbi:MAG: PEPxxWA-CTERM sorting domain-containing protein [Pseudomonadota bacterium]